MDLSILIVSWNAREDTIRCVRQFDGWREIEPQIRVVDNSSDSDDAAAIAEACPRADVLHSNENLGFSGGTNLGIRRALDASEAPILLVNNDVRLEEAAALKLLETLASHPDCGVVGPVLYHADDPEQILSAGSGNPVLHRDHSIRALPRGRTVFPVEFVSGAVVLIRPAIFDEVGLLDEAYFFAIELADLCRRAKTSGYSCLVNTEARADHDVARSGQYRETLYVYYVVRNRFLYIRKFYRFLRPALLAFWALYGAQQAFRLHRAGRKATARAIRMGVGDGLVRRFGGQNKRVLRACCALEPMSG